jgi:hypothetical protein
LRSQKKAVFGVRLQQRCDYVNGFSIVTFLLLQKQQQQQVVVFGSSKMSRISINRLIFAMVKWWLEFLALELS